MVPFELKEGRFPKGPDEIVIENWMINYFEEEVKLGDKINLNIGHRIIKEGRDQYESIIKTNETFEKIGEKEYTVVGFIQPRYFWRGSFVTQGITGLDTISNDNYGAYIKIPNKKCQ